MIVGLVEYMGASWFLYLLVLLASWNFCLNSTPVYMYIDIVLL
jgi:hypothetical protein